MSPRRPAAGPPRPPAGAAGGRIRLLEADWHALPLAAAERFDAVLLLFSALGLVRPASRRLTLLRQLRGRLADGGKLLLHAHNARWRPDGSPGADAPPPGRIGAGAQDAGDAADPLDGEDAAAGWEPGDRVMARYRGHDVDLFLHSFTLDELTDLLARAGYAVADLRPLSADRAGVYRGDDPGRGANGFLVCARAASGYA